MTRFNSQLELLRFPLKILLMGFIMLGLGLLLQNDNFAIFYTITNPIILVITEFLIKIGSFIVSNFPLIVVIKLVSRRTNSYVPILMAITGYAVYLIATMMFASNALPEFAFSNILNINYVSFTASNFTQVIRYPIQTGLIAAFVVGWCTRTSYKISRRRDHSYFNVIEEDTVALIYNFIFCALAGILVAIGWTYVFDVLLDLISYIAQDITGPFNLMLYGFFERVLNVFGLAELIREPFWYGSFSGSWVTLTGETIIGDVSIWNAMMNSGISPSGFGRFITPYYVLNIFIYPAILIGFWILYTDKSDKTRKFPLLVLAIIASILLGSMMPIELVLLFLCPLLLIIHFGLVGALFATLNMIGANLGFAYDGSTQTALPGTLFDFAIHLRDPDIFPKLMNILLVGSIFFAIYILVILFYFKFLATDLIQTGQVKKTVTRFEEVIGGYDNVSSISASPFKLVVKVRNTGSVDRDGLFELGTDRITESKDSFTLMLGQKSIMIYTAIKKAQRIQNSRVKKL